MTSKDDLGEPGCSAGSLVTGGRVWRVGRLTLILCTMFLLVGCATAVPLDAEDAAEARRVNDPAERLNRQIFAFNLGLDVAVFKPVTGIYRDVSPIPFRRSVYNFLNNLRSPVIFTHDLLQGEWQRAQTTATRFLINSSVGFLGLDDRAAKMGYEFHNEDLGQTLAVWGVPEGPFSMSPIIGPSNPRDSFGRLVELFLDPLNFLSILNGYYEIVASRTLVRGLDARDRLWNVIDEIQKTSLDPYAKLRSIYRQRRAAHIANRARPLRGSRR